MTQPYELLVIGGGAAGGSAAEKANNQSRRVALVERDHLGGTCLNYGCDPTKALLHTAHVLHQAKQSHERGLRFAEAHADWTAVQEHIQQLVRTIRGGPPAEAQAAMRQRGIDLFMDEATFVDDHHVKVGNKTLAAENILIATGADTLVPDIPGLAETGYITNKEAVYLESLPQRLAIVGGGPIGVEFAQMFGRFGVQVCLIEGMDHLLPHDEPELTEMLADYLADEIELHLQAKLIHVKAVNDGKQLTLRYDNDYEQTLIVDEILIAVGRRPALGALNPAAADVALTDDGWIQVDKTLRTNVPHIWAAGDIWPGLKFTHVAAQQGSLVVDNIFGDKPKPFADELIPWVTYCDPALAHIGATEQELVEQGITHRIGCIKFAHVIRAQLMGQTEGMIKLLVGDDDKILGAHILAVHAGELIAPLLIAMQGKFSCSVLAETLYPYPTLATAVGYAAQHIESQKGV